MFTGIIEVQGRVVGAVPSANGVALTIDAGPLSENARPGASIAVNGVCLTVTRLDGTNLTFDVIPETLSRSTLGGFAPGRPVNLERSLAVGDRLEGHFVQGHVDGLGRLARRMVRGPDCVLWFAVDEELMPATIPKGSIAVDGVSLTVAGVESGRFGVALIPTTLEWTTLGCLREGDEVNIETDILVRAVVHQMSRIGEAGGVTLAKLAEHGFL